MLKIEVQKPVAHVMLDRPGVHNAFNDELIPLVTQAFTDLGAHDDVRVIVLGGNGKSFCAGADLNWMKRMVHYSREENLEDARVLARMFHSSPSVPNLSLRECTARHGEAAAAWWRPATLGLPSNPCSLGSPKSSWESCPP